jgi:hypothetical protein
MTSPPLYYGDLRAKNSAIPHLNNIYNLFITFLSDLGQNLNAVNLIKYIDINYYI